MSAQLKVAGEVATVVLTAYETLERATVSDVLAIISPHSARSRLRPLGGEARPEAIRQTARTSDTKRGIIAERGGEGGGEV